VSIHYKKEWRVDLCSPHIPSKSASSDAVAEALPVFVFEFEPDPEPKDVGSAVTVGTTVAVPDPLKLPLKLPEEVNDIKNVAVGFCDELWHNAKSKKGDLGAQT